MMNDLTTYPSPPRTDGPSRTRTGWIVAVAALGAAVAILVVAFVLVVSGKGAEIGDLEDVVSERETEISAQETQIGSLEEDLETARTDAEALEGDLDESRERYALASDCADRAMRAWSSTLNASYSTTGVRLGTVFYSEVCEDYRAQRGQAFTTF